MPTSNRPVRILHLEDNPRDAEIVVDLLTADGLECDLVHVGTREAFEGAVTSQAFDLVLTDFNVPNYDGVSALRFLRAKDATLPLIVISGSIGEEAAVQCLRLGATDYLLKDRLDRLASAVRRALDSNEVEQKRRRAEEALRASEERFALVAQATSDAIWDWDISNGHFWSGGRLAAFAGLEHREAPDAAKRAPDRSNPPAGDGRSHLPRLSPSVTDRPPWASRLHPDDLGRVQERLEAALADVTPVWSDEYRLRSQDGKYAIVVTRANIVRDASGQPVRMVGGLTDITERKRAEERFAAMFHSSPLAIAFQTFEGRVLEANAQFFQLFGYERNEIIEQAAIAPQLWAKPEQRAQVMAAIRDGKPVHNFECEVRRKSGEIRTVLASAEVLHLGGDPMLIGMFVDVTEQKVLQTQLHQMQRVESVGRLASGIAHDMNNILAPVMMAAPLLRARLSEAQTEKILTTIETSAQRGAALVRQLLLFGRGVEGERRPVAIDTVVVDVMKITSQTFSKSIELTTQVAAQVWPVHGDPTQLHQVLLNLCVNARDAMRDGGQLKISADNVEIDDVLAATIPDARPGKYVVIRVTDTGVGIPPEIADRIFDPFFSTKGEGHGTGLGLSTVLGIVKSHRGFIQVRSVVNRGTTFEVGLPASSGEHSPSATDADAAKAPQGHGELILVVDDEENIRTILRDTLVRQGYAVITASNGVEASAAFTENPAVQLVVSDLDMPQMGGIDLGRVLRRLSRTVKLIISTGAGGRNDAGRRQKELEQIGISSVLPKPYSAATLLRAVREALDEKEAAVQSSGSVGDVAEFEKIVRARYDCDARHHSSMSVTETYGGRVWTGQVEALALMGHRQTGYCYAWRSEDGAIVTVLQVPPVISPQSAVRHHLAAGKTG